LTKSHQTCDCFILKEGDKTGSSSKSSTSVTTGQLRHISEEVADEIVEESIEDSPEELGNDTNEDSLHYFARITKHYLRLVKSSNSTSPRHEMKFPIIADSGANYHMFKELEFFETLVPATGKVILGDGKTSLAIQGIGTIKLKIDGNELTVDNVRYIPELSESIYSLFLHVQCPQHGLTSSFENGLHILFPNFTTQAVLGDHDIYLNAVPSNDSIKCTSFINLSSGTLSMNSSTYCNHITQDELVNETTRGDNILTTLREYYQDVKSKRQLSLEVPAGFRRECLLQRNIRDFNNMSLQPSRADSSSDTFHDKVINSSHSTSPDLLPNPIANEPSTDRVPILRCVDKSSSHLPSRITLTEDFIRSSVGFRRIDSIKNHLSSLYQDTVLVDTFTCRCCFRSG